MNPIVNTGVIIGTKIIGAKITPCFVWEKANVDLQITPNFKLSEFECPCKNCNIQFMSVPFVYKLQGLRDHLAIAIHLNSGYRCSAYQQELRDQGYPTAKNLSQHELGNAGDITCQHMSRLKLLASQYFKAIGTAKNWMHVDGRNDKTRRWGY